LHNPPVVMRFIFYRSPGAEMPRILIVDNEEAVGCSMTEYFRLLGYQVDYARDRLEAEDCLAKRDYSVVIEDLWLSSNTNREGLDIVEFVHERYPSTQIIVLTARGSAEIEKEACRRGASAFLAKPKPLPEIAQVVSGLLNLRDALDQQLLKQQEPA
ncbi:MAG: response regulator, partial [Pyrinomonadaceae bacterium]